MDILIKNIKMPKEIQCCYTIYPNGKVIIHWDGIVLGEAKAIELPPYGRLIDADELEKATEKLVVCDSYEYTIAHEMVKKLLKMAPTVLEASNKAEIPRKARICPHYQGVCGLDEDIVCYCSSSYEMCDKYKETDNG